MFLDLEPIWGRHFPWRGISSGFQTFPDCRRRRRTAPIGALIVKEFATRPSCWLETIAGEAILGRFTSSEEIDGVWEVLFSARILLRVSIKSASRRMLSEG